MTEQGAFNGISVIIPSWNRAKILTRMLESLAGERARFDGNSEVIVVDSSEGEEQSLIIAACEQYDAYYVEGPQSVRKKRNIGAREANFELLLFLDSDIVATPGLFQAHVEAYEGHDYVGAVQGLTEFVGDGGFWWKVAEKSGLIDSFSNARKYPFQSWSITNNLSVRRDVFFKIGCFWENFPFKLGGDDLEMSYRIAYAGYMIASAPDAIVLHTKETWDNASALLDRTKRWGTMESLICDLHPELYKVVMPKNYVFEIPLLAAMTLCTFFKCISAAGVLFLLVLFLTGRFVLECKKQHRFVNPVYLIFASAINARYEFFRLVGFARKGKKTAFMHAMVFNYHQVRGSYSSDAARLAWMMFTYLATVVFLGVIAHVV